MSSVRPSCILSFARAINLLALHCDCNGLLVFGPTPVCPAGLMVEILEDACLCMEYCVGQLRYCVHVPKRDDLLGLASIHFASRYNFVRHGSSVKH